MPAGPPRPSLAHQGVDRALARALGWRSKLSTTTEQDALLDARPVALAMAEYATALLVPSAHPEHVLEAAEEAAGIFYRHLLIARDRQIADGRCARGALGSSRTLAR
jgi:hypothetical protein